MEEKNINEKVKEKVETKSVNKPKQSQYKEYDVLVYNARTQTAIVSGRSKTSNYKLELA